MALPRDDSTYNLRQQIHGCYRPLRQRGQFLHELPPETEFPSRREQGQRHLDLWVQGSLYPIDPLTKKHPPFSSIKGILEFIGDGNNGLLGYVRNVQSCSVITAEEVRELNATVAVLKQRIEDLICNSVESERTLHELQRAQVLELNERHAIEVLELKERHAIEVLDLQERHTVKVLELEDHHTAKVVELSDCHAVEVVELQKKIHAATKKNAQLQSKITRMKKTPFGYREQVRARRDLYNLSQQGGHTKAMRRLARHIIAARTSIRVQKSNACKENRRQCLYGDSEDQLKTAKVMASFLSKTELQTIMSSPRLTSSRTKIANEYLQKIGEFVGPNAILETCDKTGITQKGYQDIYKKLKDGACSTAKGLRPSCIPSPHSVQTLRENMNMKLKELIGNYYNLHCSLNIPVTSKSVKKERITFTDQNNFFCDLEAVQRTMVRLYRFTLEELQGKPLIFVLKMDKAEIIHSQKLERMSITIMNRAMDESTTPSSQSSFFVQSEKEIWPVGCFQVPKENYSILKATLELTKIPTIMEAQESGALLKVDGVGDFSVEWHLAGDLKTLKALYGLQSGPNATFCCLYCNQPKNQQTMLAAKDSRSAAEKRHLTWNGGLFAHNIPAHPESIVEEHSRWHPILPVPLHRAHICTMHALNRICEKLLHLHFQFMWTMRDSRLQQSAIEDVEQILSSIGMHGGNVRIFEDKQLSGKANSAPRKPSISGAQAHKLFQASKAPNGSHRVYQDLVCAERNFLDNGQARHGRLQVWRALEKLLPYFANQKLSSDQRLAFKTTIEDFGKLFIKYFGEHTFW